ncbi:copper amine oxidase domain protein [Paenibacillus curdlanolyticus YK9]|uniref:Copper amine oxidase domain protein n=1 Tax=Paenibacillus curdlanolyticus YK9 TaxID=717606 RepID=E0IDU2_9BACL|nr:copper amine oxidase N-terminal domain-containing protein [Paenibacillus curdlanolyticus]EFM09296.1 copper amine oxidase domain protein [Paenibacillus curdlanolyticus YK9]
MKQKLSILLLICMAVMLVPATVFGAVAVSVTVDGTAVKFTQAPVRKTNVTMVEAKPLVAKIGATYAFDTKTKTATIKSGASVVKLTVDSKSAVVNGVKKALTVAPYSLKGYIIVPAEFVVQSLGGIAKWDGSSKLVVTSPAAVTKLSKAKALDAVNQYIQLHAKEDAKGIQAAWLPKYWNADFKEGMFAAFEQYDMQIKVTSNVVTAFSASQVTIETEFKVQYSSELYIPGEVVSETFVLVKDSAGAWKIKSERLDDSVLDLPETPAATTPEFASGVNSFVQQYVASLNAADVEAIGGLFTADSASKEEQLGYWEQLFADYTSVFKVENPFFLSVDEKNGKAAVLITYEIEDEEEEYSYESILYLSKDDAGQWKISDVLDLY